MASKNWLAGRSVNCWGCAAPVSRNHPGARGLLPYHIVWGVVQHSKLAPARSGSGHQLPLGANAERVRYAPISGPYLRRQTRPSRANSRPEQVQQTEQALLDHLVSAGEQYCVGY